MDEATSLSTLQKAVDKYIAYRSQSLKEKPGKGGHINSLFSELKNLPQFTWSFNLKFICDHDDTPIIRTFESEPLFTISAFSLRESDGHCSNAIKLSLDSYTGHCPQDNKQVLVEKIINKVPRYYCCMLEYAEDIQRGHLKTDVITKNKN